MPTMIDAPALTMLADREAVPPGSVTFGQLIRESVEKFDTQRKTTADEKHHLDLWARWMRRYATVLLRTHAADSPMLTDRREWEWHVVRLETNNEPVARAWFFSWLTDGDRRVLCNQSREIRRIRN